jgi:hypothetical protein
MSVNCFAAIESSKKPCLVTSKKFSENYLCEIKEVITDLTGIEESKANRTKHRFGKLIVHFELISFFI